MRSTAVPSPPEVVLSVQNRTKVLARCVRVGSKTGLQSPVDEVFVKNAGRLSPLAPGLEWIVCIRIAADAVLAEPIELRCSSDQSLMKTHVVVIAEHGSKATIFERCEGALSSRACEVFVGVEAEIEYVSLLAPRPRLAGHSLGDGWRAASGARCDFIQRSEVSEGGSIHWHNTTLGGSGDHHDLVSRLSGRNATSSVDWIFAVKNFDEQSVSVRNIFDAPDGSGEITLKGIAEDRGFATCDGMIEITEKGRDTNTYLTEDVLMLDRTARVDAVPGLEIRTNDVKASHSATVSRVTAEDLFYMQSRGIDEPAARAMFVEGFLSALTERITNPVIRQTVLTALQSA